MLLWASVTSDWLALASRDWVHPVTQRPHANPSSSPTFFAFLQSLLINFSPAVVRLSLISFHFRLCVIPPLSALPSVSLPLVVTGPPGGFGFRWFRLINRLFTYLNCFRMYFRFTCLLNCRCRLFRPSGFDSWETGGRLSNYVNRFLARLNET